MMQSAFENDPLAMVAIAFGRLYPDKKYHAQIAGPAEKNEAGDTEYGSTVFADDGSGEAWVDVCCDIPVIHAIEILAHELAHVAAGPDAWHGPEWKAAFDAIGEEYERVGAELGGEVVCVSEIKEDAG